MKHKHNCNLPSCSVHPVEPGMDAPNYTARSHSASANPSRGQAGPGGPSPPTPSGHIAGTASGDPAPGHGGKQDPSPTCCCSNYTDIAVSKIPGVLLKIADDGRVAKHV